MKDRVGDYSFYEMAMIGHVSLSDFEGKPQPGWYTRRLKSRGRWLPVLVMVDGTMLLAGQEIPEEGDITVDGDVVQSPRETWQWCCGHPISEEQYNDLMEELI